MFEKWTKITAILSLKVRPHLYTDANKECGTEANENDCQKVACSAGNYQKKSKILLLMWGFTYITIFHFFCPVERCLPILFSCKYGPSPLFFINICS